MSRLEQRRDFDQVTRLRLLEGDADLQERSIDQARNSMQSLVDAVRLDLSNQIAGVNTKMDKGFKECEDRDGGTRRLLTALLVSIVTLCVTVTVGVLVTVASG